MIKAVIYARYSSHSQRDESIEGQIRECTEFAKRNDFEIIDHYIDRGLSGKTDNRPSFQKLIKDSEKSNFDAVIMYTLDRFARNRFDSAVYKAKLKKNGVKMYYAKQPLPETPEGIILESVLEGYAEYYSENLSRNIKRGLKENALKGIPMHAAGLGYDIKNRKYEINETEARAVRIIFNMYAEGKTKKEIIEYLNNKGYKTSRGNKFNKNSFSKILTNDLYIGTYRFGETTIEDIVPAIIEKELFNQVQLLLEKNRKYRAKNKAKEKYLLSTKCFCGYCNSNMIGESGKSSTGKSYHYYKCKKRKNEKACNKANERKDLLEKIIVERTVNKILTDENIKKIAKKTIKLIQDELKDDSHLLYLQKELKETNKKIKNIINAIEEGLITSSTKARLEELEKAREDLEITIAEENKGNNSFLTEDHIIFWLSSFKNGNIDDKEYQEQIIDMLVNAIYLYDDKIIITYNIKENSEQKIITIKSSDNTSLVEMRRIELLSENTFTRLSPSAANKDFIRLYTIY